MENNIYLEIYEFVLQKYPKDMTYNPGIITINIESILEDECGLISIKDSVADDTQIRSCDTINGILTTGTDDIEYIEPIDSNSDIYFEIENISSYDLIKFSYYFASKLKDRKTDKFKNITKLIPKMKNLYNIDNIKCILNQITNILTIDWAKTTHDSTKYVNDPTEYTYIKKLKPNLNDKIIIIGDIHGSFATFIRILLRLKKMNVFDNKCKFKDDYHLVFLGDIIDRGIYGFEILMLIFMLKKINPLNIHINNGNHEEYITNTNYGFLTLLKTQFNEKYDGDELHLLINNIFNINHSALLIETPINSSSEPTVEPRYTYLAHGGFPLNQTDGNININFISKIKTDNKLFIKNSEINGNSNYTTESNYSNTIRWNDFYGMPKTIINELRGAWTIGSSTVEEIKNLCNIDLTIRGHQDNQYNTKLIKKLITKYTENLVNINDLPPYDKKPNTVCYGYTHLIEVKDNNLKIDEQDASSFLPVITISTNTDYLKGLVRDSFSILKFTNEVNEKQKCIDISEIKPKAKHTHVFKKTSMGPPIYPNTSRSRLVTIPIITAAKPVTKPDTEPAIEPYIEPVTEPAIYPFYNYSKTDGSSQLHEHKTPDLPSTKTPDLPSTKTPDLPSTKTPPLITDFSVYKPRSELSNPFENYHLKYLKYKNKYLKLKKLLKK
jgi:hypothetical protein